MQGVSMSILWLADLYILFSNLLGICTLVIYLTKVLATLMQYSGEFHRTND